MGYVHTDGGRAQSGRKGSCGDCAVRAMATALGVPYEDAYKEIALANKAAGNTKSVRSGVRREVFGEVLSRHGWLWSRAPVIPGRKARPYDLKGTVIARQAHHFVAVIGGVPHDVFDSSDKMVYGYWYRAE